MSNSSRSRSSSIEHNEKKRVPRVIPAELTEYEYQSEEEQNDINDLPHSSKWDECDNLFRQLEQHFNENRTNIYHQKRNALEKMIKAKHLDPMFRATIKEIESDRDHRLKVVELKRQRRIQQTERLFDAEEQELKQEFETAKANLKVAWESLYPPDAPKRRRKRYPRSIKELVARVGISWNFSTNNDDSDDNPPDDTPKHQEETSISPLPTKSKRKSSTKKSKSR
ncbi:hypothetical protein BDC45DRAFT_562944 [Circinella umbellata]|nr:hypothetical protein BDC45DRAFT_562944 [Circinella umbellata]